MNVFGAQYTCVKFLRIREMGGTYPECASYVGGIQKSMRMLQTVVGIALGMLSRPPKTVLPPTDAGISYSYSTVPANRLYAQDGSGLHAATTVPSLRRCWEMRASQHALHGTSSDSAGSLLTPASQRSGQCFCGASKAIRVTPESRAIRKLLSSLIG